MALGRYAGRAPPTATAGDDDAGPVLRRAGKGGRFVDGGGRTVVAGFLVILLPSSSVVAAAATLGATPHLDDGSRRFTGDGAGSATTTMAFIMGLRAVLLTPVSSLALGLLPAEAEEAMSAVSLWGGALRRRVRPSATVREAVDGERER